MCWRPSPMLALGSPCHAQVPPPADAGAAGGRHPQPKHDKPRLRPTDSATRTMDADVDSSVSASADAAVAYTPLAPVCGWASSLLVDAVELHPQRLHASQRIAD